jgi:hypothetical protein
LPTPLSVTHDFAASPAAVYALLIDRSFLDGRLTETGGIDPAVVSLDVAGQTAKVVTRQSIPSSALPSMVASMIPGDPVTERTEDWRSDGDGHVADLAVVIKGAPASLKGTMTLAANGVGSTLTVQGQAIVPIPLFGGKIEAIVAEQVTAQLNREAVYTANALSS